MPRRRCKHGPLVYIKKWIYDLANSPPCSAADEPQAIRDRSKKVLHVVCVLFEASPSHATHQALTAAGDAYLATIDLHRRCDRSLAATRIGLAIMYAKLAITTN